jgi:type IV pilus assembly protein PilB
LGIYELLVIDDNFRDMINADASVSNMRNVFFSSGADSLFDDGMNKVRNGLTTIDEVLRVTESNNRKQKNCDTDQNCENNC